jgi:DNA helicase-2/ATP-dependent DNA helicase PcrA
LPGFSDEDTGFDPDGTKAKWCCHIAQSKGLEWDRVYLLSANNYDFPSAQPYDSYIAEKWFVRGQLNLEAEALERLKALAQGIGSLNMETVKPPGSSIRVFCRALRVLYVGITRARRELIITWITGRRGESSQALPIIALQSLWKGILMPLPDDFIFSSITFRIILIAHADFNFATLNALPGGSSI